MNPSVLVAGIGNILLGDDGFGVAVASRLAEGPGRAGVHIEDYGIRGLHLAYDLAEGYDTLIMADAVPIDGAPGTLTVLSTEHLDVAASAPGGLDGHRMDPRAVLAAAAALDVRLDRVFVVGCRPQSLDPGIGLSPSVAAAVDPACSLVHELLDTVTAEPAAADR